MYIKRLRIDGIRNFHGPRAVDLDFTRPDGSYAGWTVLAGRNGSGKSTLLQMLALTAGLPQAVHIEYLIYNKPNQNLVTRGANEGVIDATAVSQPEYDRNAKRLDQFGLKIPRRLADGVGGGWSHSSPLDEMSLDAHSGWLLAAYGPFRRLSNALVAAVQESHTPSRMDAVRTLFEEDASLADGVTWLVRQHLFRLENQPGAAELLDTVLMLLSDGLLPDRHRIVKVDSSGLWVGRDGAEYPLAQVSDGYRSVVALVVDLIRRFDQAYGSATLADLDGRPALLQPGVVLIDEVDAHLHVSWQQQIGPWLTAHFPNIQFIVTSHSPYVCQSADPGGLIRLPGPDEAAAPHVVSQDLYERVVYGSGDDAVLTELFGLDTPYSVAAERLRRRLAVLEGRVLAGEATEAEVAEYQEVSETLTSSLSSRVVELSARLNRDS
ncbi:AAA family ATPase [Allonocardiopsis opalescens]|uniref:Putative ATP-binding protein involved in virulence n=1 Tax=Allonocardiopsis opalescens TaxID=1144618 RepID=A0A2T0PZJ3_9ACTN|nr:AAA family ATPase [Allonocardiopsis opalescens]PRX96969.1 putative ATP-binding protein involved in virulence [Allonocardiopsis opalescens]